MEIAQLQLLAGSISSLIFMSGTLTMLLKTWRTRNVDSYSMSSLMLNNAGNLVYWVYVLSLPFGPVYFLHGFYTIATILMLIWYVLYRHHPGITEHIAEGVKRITQTMEVPVVRLNLTQDMHRLED